MSKREQLLSDFYDLDARFKQWMLDTGRVIDNNGVPVCVGDKVTAEDFNKVIRESVANENTD